LKFLTVYFFLLTSVFSQTEITLYSQNTSNDFRMFEQFIVKEIIDLYNLKNDEKLSVKFETAVSFLELFHCLDKAVLNGKKDVVMSMNRISITKKRLEKYDFSEPYMANKFSALKLKTRTDINEEKLFKTKYTVGIVKNTLYEELVYELDKDKSLTIKFYSNNELCAEGLRKKEIDLYISDFVDTWIYDLEVVAILKPELTDHHGILFPKGSELRKKLNKTMRYYVKSAKYYNLIRTYFGKERMVFYKEMIYSGSKKSF